YNSLLIHARGLSYQYEFYTHKDNTEDSHIIMSKHKNPSSPQEIFPLHCLQDEAPILLKALRETQLINWHKEIAFNIVPDFLLQELQQILKEKGGSEANIIPFSGSMFIYAPGVEVSCPAGFSVEKLGDAGLQTLFNSWRYNVYADIDWYSAIVKSGLACGVYKSQQGSSHSPEVDKITTAGDSEVPIAWITLCPYGQLGLLATEEGYRRQGLGGLVTQVAAQVVERDGFIPIAMVEDYNNNSQGMFKKLGWTVVFRCTSLLMTKEGLKVDKL
ncbi:unnamed protein product, partial [Meganyctiphanes norvegica]